MVGVFQGIEVSSGHVRVVFILPPKTHQHLYAECSDGTSMSWSKSGTPSSKR
jgi:hypothetical protein